MRTVNVYEKGDRVMVKGVIAEVMVDENGLHKYRVKDGKSSLTFGTWYTGNEIIAENDDENNTGDEKEKGETRVNGQD